MLLCARSEDKLSEFGNGGRMNLEEQLNSEEEYSAE
jgi:hypothetical protein